MRRLFALSIVARLPLPMLSIGLLVHAALLTGSFAAAGIVAATFAAAQGIGGPVLGRLIDRHGQARMLAAAAACSTTVLVAIAALPGGAATALLALLAGLAGAALPPVGACMRALLPDVVDRTALAAAYVAEATASELAFVTGPMLALLLADLLSTAAAVAATAALLGVATLSFAAQRAPRAWRPVPRPRRDWAGALRSGAVRTLVAVFVLVGVLFGGVEVAIAARGAGTGGATVGAQLGAWAVGSLVAGIAMTRLGRTPRGASGLLAVLAVLAAGHLALAAVAGSPVGLGAALLLAGAAISPTYATVNAMIEQAAPAGAATEAFAWLATAIGSGTALGSALAGIVAERHGATLALLLAGSAAIAAMAIVALRAGTLSARECDAKGCAAPGCLQSC